MWYRAKFLTVVAINVSAILLEENLEEIKLDEQVEEVDLCKEIADISDEDDVPHISVELKSVNNFPSLVANYESEDTDDGKYRQL